MLHIYYKWLEDQEDQKLEDQVDQKLEDQAQERKQANRNEAGGADRTLRATGGIRRGKTALEIAEEERKAEVAALLQE